MRGQNVGYIRVSTAHQRTDRQLDGIDLDTVFTEKQSASTLDRPELHACLKHLRSHDVLHIHSIDRLARNLDDLKTIVTELVSKGVTIKFHKESLTFSGQDDPFQRLTLHMLGAFAEFERQLLKQRQAEGIAAAKRKGVRFGRKPKLSDEAIEQIRVLVGQGKEKKTIAEQFGISRTTLYKVLGN